MPKYIYECECGHEEFVMRSVTRADEEFICPRCKKNMVRGMSNPSIRSMETRDSYKNLKMVTDTKKMVHDRARNHFKEVEIKSFIDKNGAEEAVKNGWIDKDGNNKL